MYELIIDALTIVFLSPVLSLHFLPGLCHVQRLRVHACVIYMFECFSRQAIADLEQQVRAQHQAQQQQQQLLEKVLEMQHQALQQQRAVLNRLDKSSSERLFAEPSSAWRSSQLSPSATGRRGETEEGADGYDANAAYQQRLEKQRQLLKNGEGPRASSSTVKTARPVHAA